MRFELTAEHVFWFFVAVIADWYIRHKLDEHFGGSRGP